MSEFAANPVLTPALEDYLETIYRLVGQSGFARVKDIASARDVRPASVSPALKRLDSMGLVQYERREYVGLTPAGEKAARKIYARHQVLSRFLSTVLKEVLHPADHSQVVVQSCRGFAVAVAFALVHDELDIAAGRAALWQDLVADIRHRHGRKTSCMPGFERVAAGGPAVEHKPSMLERAKSRWPKLGGE